MLMPWIVLQLTPWSDTYSTIIPAVLVTGGASTRAAWPADEEPFDAGVLIAERGAGESGLFVEVHCVGVGFCDERDAGVACVHPVDEGGADAVLPAAGVGGEVQQRQLIRCGAVSDHTDRQREVRARARTADPVR